MKPVARCIAGFLTFLRDSGVQLTKTTCVGHSLGAHICGIAANYLYFRMHRIIGMNRQTNRLTKARAFEPNAFALFGSSEWIRMLRPI